MKKIMVFLLSLTIVFTPTLVFANNLGGWTINNKIAQGASTIINATKTVMINGANVVKTSTAIIKPTAQQVSKVLVRGAAGYALSVAVEQLLGAVDWVLDPANNQIVYKVPSSDPDAPSNEFYYQIPYNGFNTSKFSTADSACLYAFASGLADAVKNTYPYYSHTLNGQCYLTQTEGIKGTFVFSDVAKVANPNYDSEAEQEKKLGLDTVSEKVIDNAESSSDSDVKAGAQVATTTAVEDALANDAATQNNARQQLETNSRTQTSEEAQAETKPKDPTAPEAGSDISIKFPVFCGWAPTVCEAAQKVITFPNTLVSWWTTATLGISTAYIETMEWFKKEPETNTEQLDIETPTPFDNSIFTKDRFQVSRQCPAPQTHSMTITGQTVSFSFDLTPLCNVLEMARPALIACSYLYAAYIVIGASRNG